MIADDGAEVLFGDWPESPATRPTLEGQRLQLRAMFHAATDPGEMPNPGDLVMDKDGFGFLKPAARERAAMIVWRLLDFEDPQDRILITGWLSEKYTARADCLVALISDDGALVIHPHERAQLRHLNDEELAELERFDP